MRLQATRLGVTSAGRSAMPLDRQIAALFASGEQGVWYDIAPQYCYQDTAGTTPAAIGDPVGLVLDRSRGLALGPEESLAESFVKDSDGTFFVTLANTAGRAGKVFEVAFTVNSYTGGPIVQASGSNPATTAVIQSTGHFRAFVTANTTLIRLGGVTTSRLDVTGISLRELPGNHAYQTTATSRPILSRHPVTGIRNLLSYSEQFDDAYWTKTRTVVSPAPILDPSGDYGAMKISGNTEDNLHAVLRGAVGTNTVAVSVFAKAAEMNFLFLGTGQGTSYIAYFDLASGVVSQRGSQVLSADIVPFRDGWFRCSIATTDPSQSALIGPTPSSGLITYPGDGTSGIYIWGAQLEVGSVATPYQKVVSAADVSETGVASVHYLKFDGSDDGLVTNSIDFTSTDKMTVWAGVRKLSDAAVGMLAESSVNSTANNGAFALFAPNTTSTYALRSKGTTDVLITSAASYTSPITNVLAGLSDISGDLVRLRVNGAQVAQSTADQGTGNYGNYPLYIGRRAGVVVPFNGHIYGLLIRGAQSTDSQIKLVERYLAKKTGVTLA